MRMTMVKGSPKTLNSLAFLAKEVPGFPVHGSQVKVLHDPTDFYNEICSRAAQSRKRIVLASLYIGTGPKEKQLIDAIGHSLAATRGKTRVSILLDFCRGNRMVKGENSCTVIKPLIEKYKDSMKLSLYHTPSLRGLLKKLMPDKYNETIGIQHCKAYVFDDSTIISGANLSQDYFTNRQDRYVIVENCPKMADYFENLTKEISEFSICANYSKENQTFQFKMSDNWTGGLPYEGSFKNFVKEAHEKMNTFLTYQKTENQLKFESDSFVSKDSDPACDTWIFPSIEMGVFDIKQDTQLTTRLLESAESGSVIKFGTGYFNLTQEFLHVIMHKSLAHFDLLMAHPKANGFLGAKFPAGGIPAAYTLIANKFFDLVSNNRLEGRIKMFEYQRPGWTFHAKGLWLYQNNQSLPSATLVGSPNFGYRSAERDLEAQITIVTKNPELQTVLHDEQKRLFDGVTPVTADTFKLPERKIPTWVTWVVGLARTFF